MERRGFLLAMGTLLCGCLTTSSGRFGQSGSLESPAENSSSSDASGTDAEENPPSIRDGQGPTRGESEVDIEVQEIEDDANVEYIEGDHAVRYVARWRHTNHEEVQEGDPPEREPVYERTPFEDWAKIQCFTAAARVGAEHANDELGTDEVSGGITNSIEGEDIVAVVSVETILDRDGEPVSETSVEFDALVAATPATVHVTYHLDDQEYQLDAPVYARSHVLQQE